MKLAHLVDQHRKNSNHPAAIDRSFGDGYLCTKNRIFKKIREQTLALGFSFSCDQNDDYRALPLSQLANILRLKKIPFIDNVTVLETIETKVPRKTEWIEISDNLKGNSVFHESCHAVANAHLIDVDPSLRMMVEESYANACELLSIVDAEDHTHRAFLELNSYVFMLDDRVHLLRAEKEIGLSALTRFMTLSYMHANFLRDSIDFERVLRIALKNTPDENPTVRSVDATITKSLRLLAKIAFQLNPRFREQTTKFYFKLHGFPLDLDRDFLSEIEQSNSAKRFFASI